MGSRSGMLEAVVLGALTLLLLVGGGAAAAHFAAVPQGDRAIEGSFSPSRRAEYGGGDEQRFAPQQSRQQPTPVTVR